MRSEPTRQLHWPRRREQDIRERASCTIPGVRLSSLLASFIWCCDGQQMWLRFRREEKTFRREHATMLHVLGDGSIIFGLIDFPIRITVEKPNGFDFFQDECHVSDRTADRVSRLLLFAVLAPSI